MENTTAANAVRRARHAKNQQQIVCHASMAFTSTEQAALDAKKTARFAQTGTRAQSARQDFSLMEESAHRASQSARHAKAHQTIAHLAQKENTKTPTSASTVTRLARHALDRAMTLASIVRITIILMERDALCSTQLYLVIQLNSANQTNLIIQLNSANQVS